MIQFDYCCSNGLKPPTSIHLDTFSDQNSDREINQTNESFTARVGVIQVTFLLVVFLQ